MAKQWPPKSFSLRVQLCDDAVLMTPGMASMMRIHARRKKVSHLSAAEGITAQNAKAEYSKPLNRRGDFVRELVEGVEVCLAYG